MVYTDFLRPNPQMCGPLTIQRGPVCIPPGGRKRLSLIQMILLRHLKAGFGKEGGVDRRRDCDGYRPDAIGASTEPSEWLSKLLFVIMSPSREC